jgi:hypothetical protein
VSSDEDEGVVEKTVRGEDEATPAFALTGVTIGIGVVAAVVIGVALILYYTLGGR